MTSSARYRRVQYDNETEFDTIPIIISIRCRYPIRYDTDDEYGTKPITGKKYRKIKIDTFRDSRYCSNPV